MRICLILITIAFFNCLAAQISSAIPTSLSVSNAPVADSKNANAFTNPATTGYIENSIVGVQYENRFLLSELSTKSIFATVPTSIVNTTFSFSHFGYSLYHEMLIGCSFSRNFSDNFSLGLRFNYYATYFSSSSKYYGTILPQLGFHMHLTPTFSFGVDVFNPFQSNITAEYIVKRIPSIFSIGTQYFFTNDLIWRAQIDKEISSNYRFATGFEYSMLDRLCFKFGGYCTDYLVPCLGISTNIMQLKFDLNVEVHPLLGLTTGAGIKYFFPNK